MRGTRGARRPGETALRERKGKGTQRLQGEGKVWERGIKGERIGEKECIRDATHAEMKMKTNEVTYANTCEYKPKITLASKSYSTEIHTNIQI